MSFAGGGWEMTQSLSGKRIGADPAKSQQPDGNVEVTRGVNTFSCLAFTWYARVIGGLTSDE